MSVGGGAGIEPAAPPLWLLERGCPTVVLPAITSPAAPTVI